MFQTHSVKLFVFALLLCCSLAALSDAQQTPRSCPRHETYTPCGPPCQTECATLNEPCLIQNIRCPDGCYCDESYARDANGVCIPVNKCPKN